MRPEEEGKPENYFRAFRALKGLVDRDLERMKKTVTPPTVNSNGRHLRRHLRKEDYHHRNGHIYD